MTFDLNTLRGSSIALSILVILVPWSLWSLSTARQHQKKVLGSYPPYAPGRLPIVGHLPYLAQNITVQELFRRWSLEAGPIFTVQLGTKRWVILNSMEAINALIVGRSTIYSSRNISETLVNIVFNGGK
ncbi:hypothetical protein BX666DRAFT_196693 [Dichotomocladium elegans]|nr:hypothetical protein BX666DRAFT_196693 [Dichotomocladium elegans]